MLLNIGFISLGCAKNRVDSEIMLGCLHRAGYNVTGEVEKAEIIVVNTCGFITAAKEESIAAILDAAHFKDTGRCKKILVAGCLAQRYGQELLDEIPEIDGVMGTGSVPEIVDVLNRISAGERPMVLESAGYEYPSPGARILTTPVHSAYLKIAEGCDSRCTYCAIPGIRGPYHSRPQESIIAEAQELCARGVRELVVVAQETTRYGVDLYGRYQLADLLVQLESIEQCRWIRLMYCHPDSLTRELIELVAGSEKICRYIDLPLQHANKRILRMMNRKGTGEELLGLVGHLRRAVPGLTLRTTFLVGFPGETEAEFNELLEFMATARFERAGVFGYSPEEGTAAAMLPDRIDESIIKERVDRAMVLQQTISLEHNKAMIGRELAVLAEGWDDDQSMYWGRWEGDAPEIDGKVYFASVDEVAPGDFVRVKVLDASEYDLTGVQVQ
ncbi:MAG TPA: 30S ribosomal protein S12 methylthiotransferase RimO [Desulfotomaculum sp.]|nr:MAG: ribosomal protein S12 methylthiotransferase [Peptococcaceae bacterium BRH_c8a]KJS77572.1 MAG: ribosomal protein S12 methylthiotransferase [Desulfotomaculum sp. BICA1-6]HBX22493.1 30S ribosomal protein S12 methylthiotransferase RimO [Desulfotomaculum sp.]